MRFNRIALVAGLLALGVAACGDSVEIVQPAPEPPPPPVTATMLPVSASVVIGNSTVFAVNVSGGVVGDAASWTCASSNTGVATASNASVGCQATGVAAGSATITATVTKSGETVNVGAQLTVTEEETGDPAFVSVRSITGEGNTTPRNGLRGRVDVEITVERGDRELERLSLLVDGTEVAFESFVGGHMPMPAADDAAAQQAPFQVQLSFRSHDHDPQTGTPVYAKRRAHDLRGTRGRG